MHASWYTVCYKGLGSIIASNLKHRKGARKLCKKKTEDTKICEGFGRMN